MRLTVFGASGKVGRLVVEEALKDGHKVTAFVRSNNPFEEREGLLVIQGDIHNTSDVAQALEGADSVISTLGSWGTKTKEVVSTGVQNIVPIMQKNGQKRIITLTGSGARWSEDSPGFLQKAGHSLIGIVNSKVLQDGEKHIQILEASKLDWTVIRSPVMSAAKTKKYKLDFIEPPLYQRVSRRAVARCMVDQLKNASYIRKAPHIHKY